MIGKWSSGPVPPPQPGVVLLVMHDEPWAYREGVDGVGYQDWVDGDGDPLGWTHSGFGERDSEHPWMLLFEPDRCQACGEEPSRCMCEGAEAGPPCGR